MNTPLASTSIIELARVVQPDEDQTLFYHPTLSQNAFYGFMARHHAGEDVVWYTSTPADASLLRDSGYSVVSSVSDARDVMRLLNAGTIVTSTAACVHAPELASVARHRNFVYAGHGLPTKAIGMHLELRRENAHWDEDRHASMMFMVECNSYNEVWCDGEHPALIDYMKKAFPNASPVCSAYRYSYLLSHPDHRHPHHDAMKARAADRPHAILIAPTYPESGHSEWRVSLNKMLRTLRMALPKSVGIEVKLHPSSDRDVSRVDAIPGVTQLPADTDMTLYLSTHSILGVVTDTSSLAIDALLMNTPLYLWASTWEDQFTLHGISGLVPYDRDVLSAYRHSSAESLVNAVMDRRSLPRAAFECATQNLLASVEQTVAAGKRTKAAPTGKEEA